MSSSFHTQRFCLRWNNHQSNLLSVFDQLLHDESFVDVTLAVEGRLLRAHKMVLSACSPYFQALFVGHPDKHPIVILKDVPFCDMRNLLDFMYRGEVSVDQDRLTAFLKVAESLRIKGLTEVNEDKSELSSVTSSLLSGVPNVPVAPTHTPPPPHLHRIHPHPNSHKRMAPFQATANPLLGSALTAPKRKRGRPRKLSGSSGSGLPNLLPATPVSSQNPATPSSQNPASSQDPATPSSQDPATPSQNPATTNGSSGENASGSTPSNMLDGNNSDMETPSRLTGINADSHGQDSSEAHGRDASEGSDYQHSPASGIHRQAEGENGAGSTHIPSLDNKAPLQELLSKIKQEPEPAPGPSSQDPEQAFLRPGNTQDSENYPLGLIPAPSKYLIMSGGNMVAHPGSSSNGPLDKSPAGQDTNSVKCIQILSSFCCMVAVLFWSCA